MLVVLVLLALVVSAADHWTTYLCLRSPVAGFDVVEANPIAAALFDGIGLVEGLAIDSLFTIGAMAFLLTTTRLPRSAKVAFLGLVIVWTGAAVANNLRALEALELSLFG